MNKLVDFSRLHRVFTAAAGISVFLGLAFLVFDPEAGISGVVPVSREVKFQDVSFLVVKSPKGTESRVAIFDDKGIIIFTTSCDGIAEVVCVQENYQARVNAAHLSAIESGGRRGILRRGEYTNRFGSKVYFENPRAVEQLGERKRSSNARVENFLGWSLLFGIAAFIVKRFERKGI